MKFSCGVIPYKIEDGEVKYLLVESAHNHFGFPKGGMEENETKLETAKRELFEETGLVLEIQEDTELIEVYESREIEKTVTYFLAEFNNQKIIIPEDEILQAVICTYDEAMGLLDHHKDILEQAKKIIEDKAT